MGAENDFSSFKHLLKQVYSAHSTKVKDLENEIKLLKEKLLDKERKTNSSIADCKRCIELEEAFKASKKALHEQAKWFENFGQKFSIFGSSELDNPESKDDAKLSYCAVENAQITSNFKKNSNLCDEKESSVALKEKYVDIQNHENKVEHLSTLSCNKNLLKKVMLEDGESFDVYTVTFNQNLKHDNMNIKLDSMILAPDSLSTVLDVKKASETGLKECSMKNGEKSKKKFKYVEEENSKPVEGKYQDSKIARKRLSSESLNEGRLKRYNKGELSESSCEISKTKANISSTITPKILANEPCLISENVECVVKGTTDLNTRNIEISKNRCTITGPTASKENNNETPKNTTLMNNLVKDLKNKTVLNQTSPSLLPAHLNIPPKIIDLDPISNDDDFQEQIPSSKIQCSEDSWDTCDRKKFLKKNRNIKFVKSTSKYKMTLDAPPLNYKKPTYKQTKLSKSIFQSKSSDSSKKSPQVLKSSKNNSNSDKVEDDDFSTVLQEHFQSSTPVDSLRSPVVDIDATFIPDDFKLESPQYNTTNVKKNTVEKSNLKNGSLFSNISFPKEPKSSLQKFENSSREENDIEDISPLEDIELKENSFDRLPLPEEPNYKYKNDVVRKKAERRQLNGFDCKECEKYYSELGLTDKEKKERMKKCSRHRGKYTPPATPDHFWELDFPDTEECKARGYVNETQKVNLNNICDI